MQLKKLFSAFVRTRRSDSVFGSMVFMGNRLRYWEGQAFFSPEQKSIEVFVDGSAEDDLADQKAFFDVIQKEWPTVRQNIDSALKLRLGSRPEANQVDSFRVSSLSIPKGSWPNSQWEVTMRSNSSNIHPNASLRGAKVEEASWDT